MFSRDRSLEDARLRRLGIVLISGFFIAESLLRASYVFLGARATGSTRPFLDSLTSELTSGLAVAVGFFAIVMPASRRWPLGRARWRRHLPVHVAALLVYSAAKSMLMWGMRVALWPLLGLGRYDYGDLAFRFPMEFSSDVVGYVLLVAITHAWDAWIGLRDRELREARLEASLGEARLQALQAQLQPHFLFNTLNMISSIMYADPDRADRLMSRLSDLLRSTLASPPRSEGALEEELHVLDEYVEIMRARFGDRLAIGITVDPAAREANVPLFLIQPLLENAIQHGVAKRAGRACIAVEVVRNTDSLVVRVTDDGPGITGDPAMAIGRGIGLSNTVDRLRHLYGDAASLALANRPEGGLTATVRLPFVRAVATIGHERTSRAHPRTDIARA